MGATLYSTAWHTIQSINTNRASAKKYIKFQAVFRLKIVFASDIRENIVIIAICYQYTRSRNEFWHRYTFFHDLNIVNTKKSTVCACFFCCPISCISPLSSVWVHKFQSLEHVFTWNRIVMNWKLLKIFVKIYRIKLYTKRPRLSVIWIQGV